MEHGTRHAHAIVGSTGTRMSGPCDTWDKCIKLISSDRALLDVLVRGARRRYEFVRGIVQLDTSRVMDDKEKAISWSEAIREVVSAAFTDDGVVRLLKQKMISCKEQYESAARTGPSAKTEGSARASAMAAAPAIEFDGENRQATERLGIERYEARERCGLMQRGQALGRCSGGGKKARQQEGTGPERTTAVGGDAVPRMVSAGSAVDSPVLLLRQMGSNSPLTRNTEGREESPANDLPVANRQSEKQRLPGSVVGIEWGASSLQGEGEINVDCTADVGIERNVPVGQGPTPLLAKENMISGGLEEYGCGGDDLNWSSSSLGALGRDSDLVVVKHGDQQSCFSTRANISSRQSLPFSWSGDVTDAAAVDSAGVADKKAVPTPSLGLPELCFVPPRLVDTCSIEHDLEAPADVNVVAATGMLGAYHQQQAMAGQASVPVVEETAQTSAEVRDFEGNRVTESERRGSSTTTTTEGSGATNQQTAAGNNAGLITVTRGVADSATIEVGKEVENTSETEGGGREVTPTTNKTATKYEQGDAAGGKDGATKNTVGINGDIFVLPEMASIVYESPLAQETSTTGCDDIVLPKFTASVRENPATCGESLNRIATEDEEEDYGCDDFEPATSVGDQKRVHFSDKASWTVHEIRASFEAHELIDLFYSTSELDRVLEEVEQEEKDDQSGAQRLTSGGRGDSANEHGRAPVCEDADVSPVEGSYFDVLEDSLPEDDVYLESFSIGAAEDSDDDF